MNGVTVCLINEEADQGAEKTVTGLDFLFIGNCDRSFFGMSDTGMTTISAGQCTRLARHNAAPTHSRTTK